jgi:chemotaxis protein MotB
MARRKKHQAHENHERWLVSYADFITLLFAFFVVMFASSQSDKGSAAQVSESVKKALEENQFAAAIAGILGGAVGEKGKGNAMMRGPGGTRRGSDDATPAKVVELLPSEQFLSQEMKEDIERGKVDVHMSARGLVVSLREAAFFTPGDDTISADAYSMIAKIAETILKLPNPVRLEGHTDAVPIHNSRFRSNWELSTARAIAMLVILSDEYGVPAARLAVAGYADTVPIDTNDTAEGRAHNRRVDIIILNQTGLIAEPEASP